ncbi:MAG: hypothetical protein GY759_23385 [Chloroflexi bacterium]|nr:hypothetical protein [Chloroflexota bacterium]
MAEPLYVAKSVALRLGVVIILVGLSLVISFSVVHAQETPLWRQNLTCDGVEQRFQGLEYCTDASGTIHVIVVDMNSPAIQFEYVIAEGLNGKDDTYGECLDVNVPQYGPVRGGCHVPGNPAKYPALSLSEAISRYPQAAVIVNSDYWGSDGNKHGPEGFTVVQGDRRDGPALGDTDNNAANRPWLALGDRSPIRVEFGQFGHYGRGPDDGESPDWVYTATGGTPWLIREGKVRKNEIDTCEGANLWACRAGAEQTAAGVSKDKRWLFFVLDTRSGQATLMSLAEYMAESLDIFEAIKFDGGTSTQFVYAGHVMNTGGEVPAYLAVITSSGHGIEIVHKSQNHASPTSAIFYDVVLPGERVTLDITLRNEGTATWSEPTYRLDVLTDNLANVPQSAPVIGLVKPGETYTFSIRFDIPANILPAPRLVQYQMTDGNESFGIVVNAYVFVIPQQLRDMEQEIREQIAVWQRQGEQATEAFIQDLTHRIVDRIQKEAEEQVENILQGLLSGCNSPALLVGTMLTWIALRRRR